MGLAYPKTLFPIAGKPILGHILTASDGVVDTAMVVVSATGKVAVEEYLKTAGWNHARTAIQEKPIGMADAVSVGVRAYGDDQACDYLVIWGDQVTVRRETLEKVVAHHCSTGAWLTFPTSWRASPYIHIVRDANGRVCGVLEAREGDAMPSEGESDCGVFLVRGEVIKQGLSDLRTRTWDSRTQRFCRLDGSPSHTGEFNFLPLIGLWALQGALVEALCVATPDETRGVNTVAEVVCVERSLLKR
jgi:bifunctional N-acetylglucosamine-1-phosphate-uridyltransferase/glucosamine-1-phosphate-acetyltransferase GlmU-like protein